MTFQPDEQEQIYARIRDAVAAGSEITNFSPNSPERALTDDGFAAEMRERQHELLSVRLSCLIDYAGKTITAEDLDNLGIDPELVTLDLLNSYQESSDLDELVKRNSVNRDPGSLATGVVTFSTTSDSVTVPEGTSVYTEPDSDGKYLEFLTTEKVSPASGTTTVDANVESVKRGSKYNVGSNTIVEMLSPPPGVNSVTNNNATTGGEDEESDPALRARAKQFLIQTSGGGTKGGLEGALISAFSGLEQGDVIVDEFPNSSPIYADVIVDGGPSDADAKAEIDESRPVAVTHNLVRPIRHTLDVTVDVTGSSIDTTEVESDLNQLLTERGLGEDLTRDKVIQTVMNGDDGIEGISSLRVRIVGETHTYDSDNSGGNAPNHPLYHLDKGDAMSADADEEGNGLVSVTGTAGGASTTFTEGTDYDEGDVGADGTTDAIDWGLAGTDPDEDTDFTVEYDIKDDLPIGDREKADPGTMTVTVV